MGDLSRNFSRWEFMCGHCGRVKDPDRQLVRALQALRDDVGTPLRIVSGYRCATHNRRVGGKWFSQHLRAAAADIPGGYATVAQCWAAGFIGVGVRAGRVVHVDVTPRRRPFVFDD